MWFNWAMQGDLNFSTRTKLQWVVAGVRAYHRLWEPDTQPKCQYFQSNFRQNNILSQITLILSEIIWNVVINRSNTFFSSFKYHPALKILTTDYNPVFHTFNVLVQSDWWWCVGWGLWQEYCLPSKQLSVHLLMSAEMNRTNGIGSYSSHQRITQS